MNLTAEQLNVTEEMAGLFFSTEEIATNLELTEEDEEEFNTGVENRDTALPMVAAYYRGWLGAEIALRKAIRQSALNGSSPSQQQLINFQKESRR
jgi:hypothetical protein